MRVNRASAVRALPFASAFRAWEWQEGAACSGTETDLFFGGEHESPRRRASREARVRAVCASCPVRLKCLQFALDHRIRYGVWGGMDEAERAAMLLRLRRRQAAASYDDQGEPVSPLGAPTTVAAG